jgi:hypothetical protein
VCAERISSSRFRRFELRSAWIATSVRLPSVTSLRKSFLVDSLAPTRLRTSSWIWNASPAAMPKARSVSTCAVDPPPMIAPTASGTPPE